MYKQTFKQFITSMERYCEYWHGKECLVHEELCRVHGNRTVQCRTAVSMVHLVYILVQPRIVEESVWVVTDGFVVEKQGWDRHQEIGPTIVADIHI